MATKNKAHSVSAVSSRGNSIKNNFSRSGTPVNSPSTIKEGNTRRGKPTINTDTSSALLGTGKGESLGSPYRKIKSSSLETDVISPRRRLKEQPKKEPLQCTGVFSECHFSKMRKASSGKISLVAPTCLLPFIKRLSQSFDLATKARDQEAISHLAVIPAFSESLNLSLAAQELAIEMLRHSLRPDGSFHTVPKTADHELSERPT
jgi:hypothetical protein